MRHTLMFLFIFGLYLTGVHYVLGGRFNKHDSPDQVTQEFKNLDFVKEERVIFADRAPNTSEGGRLWLDYNAGTLYFRHPNTGAWTAL